MANFKNTILISEDVLKDNSLISDNVDMSVVVPSIRLIQDKELQSIMGTKLYREVQRQVNSGTIEARITTLLDDFIEHILIHGTVAESVTNMSYRFGNLTVAKNDGDNENNLSESEMRYLSKKFTDNMQFYLSRLNDYLCENEQTYPEFNANIDDDIRPNRKPYRNGIYTGRRLEELYEKKLPAWVRYRDF